MSAFFLPFLIIIIIIIINEDLYSARILTFKCALQIKKWFVLFFKVVGKGDQSSDDVVFQSPSSEQVSSGDTDEASTVSSQASCHSVPENEISVWSDKVQVQQEKR